MQTDKFIRIKQVSEIIGIAPSTIYQWLREGKHNFPAPIKIGGKTSLYRLSEVTEWVNGQAAGGY
ncbi:MAG: AlpA family phage regulatory protein [Geobacteraceae bacterium]|nr:AlpA family phage regulatory protein [Geobacteraceae bacterium]